MSRNQGDLRSDLRDRLNEPSERFWSDKELNRWINEGAQDIARRARCLFDSTSRAIAASSGTTTLPSNGLVLHRAEFSNDGGVTVYPLEFRDPNEMDEFWIRRTQQNYRPSFLVEQGYPGSSNWNASLYPIPSSSGTLTIYYYRTANPTNSDTDTIDLPSGWEDLTVLYASYVALRKDANPQWQLAKEEYTEKLGALVDLTQRYHDQAGYIVAGPSIQPGWLVNDDVGGW